MSKIAGDPDEDLMHRLWQSVYNSAFAKTDELALCVYQNYGFKDPHV
jgi:hypothetical protein